MGILVKKKIKNCCVRSVIECFRLLSLKIMFMSVGIRLRMEVVNGCLIRRGKFRVSSRGFNLSRKNRIFGVDIIKMKDLDMMSIQAETRY